MKPKLVHQEAMVLSSKAKEAMDAGRQVEAYELYRKAADLESSVAEFYFDKPELEPTQSVMIRSAAFLNLKAGQIEAAQKFIFFGLLHSKDELIRTQLNDALELSVSLRHASSKTSSAEFNYLQQLRQKSVHYTLEPAHLSFGHSVTIEVVRDFFEGYLKSLRAYAKSQIDKLFPHAEQYFGWDH
jgi:hypothetical protein